MDLKAKNVTGGVLLYATKVIETNRTAFYYLRKTRVPLGVIKETMTRAIKKRISALAFILSVITPGLGQFYCGRGRRAGFLYGVGLVVSLLFFLGFYRWFYGFLGYICFVVIYVFFCLGDAVRLALVKSGNGVTDRFNRWYYYAGIGVVHLAFVLPVMFIIVSPLKPYRVPTDSMVPTLLPGDYFLVDKRYYSDRMPERGDVVVFLLPGSRDRIYVKRVMGLPGDELRINNDILRINKEKIEEPYLNKSSWFGNKSFKEFGPETISKNSFFILGDNRNQSSDSRQFGAVDISSIKGKVLYLIGARDKNRIGNLL